MGIEEKMYLIGAFSNGKLAQAYFDSLSVLGDTVEPIIVQYLRHGEFDEINKPQNVKLIKYKKEYPGNTGKHKYFREIISPLLERDVWCIFTDMHDVVFQSPLPTFPQYSDVILAYEDKKFGEVDYWKSIFPENVWDWNIYNVGCFAMKRDAIREFWDYLYQNWMDFYQWYKQGTIMRIGHGDSFPFNIPFHEKVKIEMAMMFNGHYDTLCFNTFVKKKNFSAVRGLFGCYAYQVESGSIQYENGKLYRDDELVSIAHFN